MSKVREFASLFQPEPLLPFNIVQHGDDKQEAYVFASLPAAADRVNAVVDRFLGQVLRCRCPDVCYRSIAVPGHHGKRLVLLRFASFDPITTTQNGQFGNEGAETASIIIPLCEVVDGTICDAVFFAPWNVTDEARWMATKTQMLGEPTVVGKTVTVGATKCETEYGGTKIVLTLTKSAAKSKKKESDGAKAAWPLVALAGIDDKFFGNKLNNRERRVGVQQVPDPRCPGEAGFKQIVRFTAKSEGAVVTPVEKATLKIEGGEWLEKELGLETTVLAAGTAKVDKVTLCEPNILTEYLSDKERDVSRDCYDDDRYDPCYRDDDYDCDDWSESVWRVQKNVLRAWGTGMSMMMGPWMWAAAPLWCPPKKKGSKRKGSKRKECRTHSHTDACCY